MSWVIIFGILGGLLVWITLMMEAIKSINFLIRRKRVDLNNDEKETLSSVADDNSLFGLKLRIILFKRKISWKHATFDRIKNRLYILE